MVNFCLFGAGRIGKLHARNIAGNPRARLHSVYDVAGEAARQLAEQHGATPAPTPEAALGDPAVEAVLIASSTNTHVDLIGAAARAGKAVFCEKPIDLDIRRVDALLADLPRETVLAIGFNRRFDPTHRAVHRAIRDGEVGELELLVITSRDPAPPPLDYVRVSGGLFRDMMIHDFDMARWLLGEEPVEVFAQGSCLVDPAIGQAGDIDTAMVVMKTASGRLAHINNSRRAVYGYDQRIEAFGSAGMVASGNQRSSAIRRTTASQTDAGAPLLNFFLERYAQSYVDELDDFIDAVAHRRMPLAGAADGRRALLLADAALESHRTGRAVRVG